MYNVYRDNDYVISTATLEEAMDFVEKIAKSGSWTVENIPDDSHFLYTVVLGWMDVPYC